MRSLTRDEVREVDRRAIHDYGLPGVVLMENAGRNAAALLHSLEIAGPIAIVCGKGNNAGDGFVIARHLQNLGCEVEVFLASDPAAYQGDAGINYRVMERSDIPCVQLARAAPVEWIGRLEAADWIVDALLGTGIAGQVREPFITIIAAVNNLGKQVFAVDVPSGLDCDSGQDLGECIRATVTGTFVARKVGFDRPEAARWTGRVEVLDIGVPQSLLREFGLAVSP